MRRRFFELFWEEQLEREREGKPLRIPTGRTADELFLLGAAELQPARACGVNVF